MVMLIWMRVRVRAMARFQTEVSEVSRGRVVQH